MYQPYPSGGQQSEAAVGPAPAPLLMAVKLMYAGAAVSLIGIAWDLMAAGGLETEVRKLSPKLTAAQAAGEAHMMVAFLIMSSLIAGGLWLWMAGACKAGKSWVRKAAVVLFGLETLRVAVGLVGGAMPGSGASRFYGVLVWLIGLVALVLLWQRQSSQYLAVPPAAG